ncbi:hypothetical protein K505DRAFT_329369 [Melanomma pulvis-pyrius CBS 109.77]|uniref:Uncharacterized protein n=1 Tax=Melanomma pulvis-pyrius CBS 109.77 TaxID=1314802 RepID=A0A6A6WUU0_9PLEO|nr:hypothetical protein K505DRAFT_329369 [Melanomma pulvis-pyrius CBS 109.77]
MSHDRSTTFTPVLFDTPTLISSSHSRLRHSPLEGSRLRALAYLRTILVALAIAVPSGYVRLQHGSQLDLKEHQLHCIFLP